MSIQSYKKKFEAGEITKHQLIEDLYQYHDVLFNFSETLKDTEIEKIEVSNTGVCFVTRETNFHPGGLKFMIDRDDKTTSPLTAFNFDILEKDDSEIIFKMVNKGDVVFDIGANIGWYSNHLAKKVESGYIYSFEPIPNTFNQLKQNIALNKFENVSINNIALTETPQTLTFYFSPKFSGAASSLNITGSTEITELKCPASTMDIYVAEKNISKIDFIKCDVEGAEYFVFKGGLKSLEKYKPIVFTEMLRKWAAKFDYHPNDIIKLFTDLNYLCFVSDNGKMSEIKEVTESTMQTNYLFLHKEKHSSIINSF